MSDNVQTVCVDDVPSKNSNGASLLIVALLLAVLGLALGFMPPGQWLS